MVEKVHGQSKPVGSGRCPGAWGVLISSIMSVKRRGSGKEHSQWSRMFGGQEIRFRETLLLNSVFGQKVISLK